MDAHLVALKARLVPMRSIGMNLLTAAIRAYNVLWPGCEAPMVVDELATCLLASEARLDDWRSSAARVGADEAMMYVLSWYEKLDLDKLKTLRDGSKWLSDPDHIRRRQESAHALIQYAPVHSFVAGDRVPQSEEIPAEEDEGEDEDEAVDEEIEADTPPESAIGTATATTTEKTATETPAPPSAQKTSDAAA